MSNGIVQAKTGLDNEADLLSTLLSLMSDAALVFDQNGTILLANDEARQTFRMLPGSIVEQDVRTLFPPAATVDIMEGPLESALPFELDGTSSVLTCVGGDNKPVRVRVRCERAAADREVYVLTALALVDEENVRRENERLVEELSRTNRRLSGTLSIVLGTLDSLDMGTLFSRILDRITNTMDAWATLAYMAEQDGYRLRGYTESLGNAAVPAFVPYDYPLAEVVYRAGRSLCMRVPPPTKDELRKGEILTRTVLCEEVGMSLAVPAELMPPFSTFVIVPVWFGGHVIALLVVGWKNAHSLRKDDVRLLDAVAEYLSVQLAGAFATLKAQHADMLESLGSSLRERLMSNTAVNAALLDSVFGQAAEGIEATCVALAGNQYQNTTIATLDNAYVESLPFDLCEYCKSHEVPCVTNVEEERDLYDWIRAQGAFRGGLLVALGKFEDVYYGFLLLRGQDMEPFEDVDVSFVRRLSEDVREVEEGKRLRNRDKRISQALQLGMRNKLQEVDGLSTQSKYQSATEAAYVGGDFYDLVRLPKRHACAIMGDVSGKGVEAASVSSAVKTALAAYAWEGLTPARMVSLLNDFLLGFSRIETFATMFVGIVDLKNATLSYCSAGHPPALLVRARTGELVTLGVQSGVVGAFEGLRYLNGEVVLENGDILVLYTDGVTEARDSEGAFFGEDGLHDVLLREVTAGFDGLCDRILDSVSSFAGGSLEDDVSLVVIRFDSVGSSGKA